MLIARTGRTPVTLAVQPALTLIAVIIAVLTPIAILGATIYSLHQKNAALAERNEELSEAANDVIQELEVLDDEITMLRERAGLAEDGEETGDLQSRTMEPRGGISTLLEAEELFAIAQAKIPSLSTRLYSHVKPALDETLDEEEARAAARPKGKPVKADSRISSHFGLRRNPFGWGYEVHDGIDFTGPVGIPIYATAPGTVTKAEYQRGYGYHIVIDHGYSYSTLYAHLSQMSVSAGDTVTQDNMIGRLGSTGRSTGPHLHYSVYYDGKAVDPMRYID